MPKKIRTSPLYIASGIKANKDNNNNYNVYDEIEKISLDPNNPDDKIKIYKRQVENWFLNPAEEFLKLDDCGFIVLMICLSYFEGVEEYKQGKGSNNNSKSYFIDSINKLYPNIHTNKQLGDLYKEARCGLFHTGMIKGKTIISYDFESPINFVDENTIKINPELLLRDIKKDFSNFIEQLRNDTNKKQRFSELYSNIFD